jgi:hypothetical protein
MNKYINIFETDFSHIERYKYGQGKERKYLVVLDLNGR